jgi:pyruvate/2-oxoglutarate dehydrogenase complex dihydrolipoamide dehydrogenase (E3) component
VPDLSGVFVAGDWVGPQGLLADAAFASGRAAGLAALDDMLVAPPA